MIRGEAREAARIDTRPERGEAGAESETVEAADVFELEETPFMTLYIALNQIREKFDYR